MSTWYVYMLTISTTIYTYLYEHSSW